MQWTYWAASIPKLGNNPDDNEDSYAIEETADGALRATVADGATESFRSQDWSSRLTRGFVESKDSAIRAANWLPDVQASFNESVSIKELPWHAQIKASSGAHASLIGLELDLNEGRFRTLHVGDCCMLTSGAQPRFFPKSFVEPGRFNNRPNLVGSRSPILPYPHTTKRRYLRQDEDVIWLMSDAIARYALDVSSYDLAATVKLMKGITDQECLANIVKRARDHRTIVNDDVTLIRIDLVAEG